MVRKRCPRSAARLPRALRSTGAVFAGLGPERAAHGGLRKFAVSARALVENVLAKTTVFLYSV
jgi:hypothetical protein